VAVSNYETEFIAKLEQIILSSGGSIPPMTGPTNFQLRSLELLDALNFATSGSKTAAGVTFTPTGTIAASNVQAAIAEVASEAAQKASNLSDLANVATARSNLGATNSPAFSVYKTASQSIASSTFTQVTWDAEESDTSNAFSSQVFTVPAGFGGAYLFGVTLSLFSSDVTRFLIELYKNGSQAIRFFDSAATGVGVSLTASGMAQISLAAGDQVHLVAYITSTSGNPVSTFGANTTNRFWGLRLIA
jgi:hypothetical protein